MTTTAPEAAPAPAAPPAGKAKGNLFTRKLGPLPMWVWLTIGIALIVGIAYYKSRTSSAASQSATGTDASQVPQFVNQTYTTVAPPTAPGPPPPASPPPTPKPPPKRRPRDDDDEREDRDRDDRPRHPRPRRPPRRGVRPLPRPQIVGQLPGGQMA